MIDHLGQMTHYKFRHCSNTMECMQADSVKQSHIDKLVTVLSLYIK